MLVHVCGIHESLPMRILQSSHQGLRLHSRSDSQIPQQDIWSLAGQQGKRRIECQTRVNSATDVVGYSKKQAYYIYLSFRQFCFNFFYDIFCDILIGVFRRLLVFVRIIILFLRFIRYRYHSFLPAVPPSGLLVGGSRWLSRVR